ncbi:MAG TPA: cation-transporting P-type ATPase [Mucilaginibacter sp.]|jgi:Mg2+-importing ATPase|nr:cation-transporting P-type ATPase [Mucilaginibacter sp.]
MNKKDALHLSQTELIAALNSSPNGLSQKEAEKRLLAQGPNVLGKKTANAFNVLVRQLKSSLVYLLVVASALSFGIKDYTDGTIILIILSINTSLGFYQEYKSEKIIEKLSEFITKQVRLKRDGQTLLLDESVIVTGDIINIHEGDIVPADVRLFETDNLQVDESQLTGESVPVTKQAAGGADVTDGTMLFTGSVVQKGGGTGVVYATGKETELGTIATLSTETKKQTQYEKSLQSFSALLIRVVLIGLALVFTTKIILNHGFSNVTELLLFIIALAVSTVPEVLPVITTVTLSGGALKLAKKNVVVKRLSAMEDLGNVNLLCTDKTGTLTENKMAVHSIVASDDKLFQKLAYATVVPLKNRKRRTQGSYDDAFLKYVAAPLQQEAKCLVIRQEVPFDPEDRRRRVVLEDTNTHFYYLVVIGAPDMLLNIANCDKKTEYLDTIAREGSEGLHHLAVAYKKIDYSPGFDIIKNERGLEFLGCVSLEDPLRPSTKTTITHAETLGIKIKILTGDSREVAGYVGRQVGLIKGESTACLGDELEKMSPAEFDKAVLESNVFARVSPTQKFSIIQSLKKQYVVAYQGDGINDAPALKLADVAIAVNSATDIAKENADIVLLNKSLEVIINGVKYGRSIFVNINKYIRYTMLNNFGMFIALSVMYLCSTALPILAVQVLLNNLFGDIPLVTVSADSVDDDEVVRPEQHNIRELMMLSIVLGIPTAIFELVYFVLVHKQATPVLQTSLYVFFTYQALIIFYAIRNNGHFWKTKLPPPLLNISFFLAFAISLAIIYIPTFQSWFSFVPLPLASVLTIIGFVVFYFFATDAVKVWYYKSRVKVSSAA